MKLKILVLLGAFLAILLSCTHSDTGGMSMDGSMLSFETSGNVNSDQYVNYGENPFILTADDSLSTFSVDVDGASYANTRRFLNLSSTPPIEAIRIEEFLNYFPYDYPEPDLNNSIAINTELSPCPWNTEHLLLRIGLRGRTLSNSEIQPSNYVFLIDVSGSMNDQSKLGILKAGFIRMLDSLNSQDRVAIVTYAGNASVLLPSTSIDNKDQISAAISKLGASGSTAGAKGIITAYEIAEANFITGGNNRIIIGSDGDFNVGPSSIDQLIDLIVSKRNNGIYLTVLGVGSGNLNDAMMEQIANKGNGNYEYIDNAEQVEKIFVRDRLKFYPVAKDVKIQIQFQKEYVASYRLIGYENRALADSTFEIDTTDAGEIGSSQDVTALYELVTASEPISNQGVGTINIRYKDPIDNSIDSMTMEIPNEISSIADASENQLFAQSLAAFAMILKQSEYSGSADKQMVLDLANQAMTFDPYGYRADYISMVELWNP